MNKVWILWAVSAMVTVGCSSLLCRKEALQRATAPDGVLEAVAFYEDCGATADITRVAIVTKGERGEGDGGQAYPFAADGKWEISLRWELPRKLIIHAKGDPKYIVNQAVRWQQIPIEYELTKPDGK